MPASRPNRVLWLSQVMTRLAMARRISTHREGRGASRTASHARQPRLKAAVRLHHQGSVEIQTGALSGRYRYGADQQHDLQIDTLHLDSVQVNDTREPTPTQPLTELVLPLPMNLTWSVDRLRIEGRQTLALDGARGHYRYGPADTADRSAWKEWGSDHAEVRDAHHLRIDHGAQAVHHLVKARAVDV